MTRASRTRTLIRRASTSHGRISSALISIAGTGHGRDLCARRDRLHAAVADVADASTSRRANSSCCRRSSMLLRQCMSARRSGSAIADRHRAVDAAPRRRLQVAAGRPDAPARRAAAGDRDHGAVDRPQGSREGRFFSAEAQPFPSIVPAGDVIDPRRQRLAAEHRRARARHRRRRRLCNGSSNRHLDSAVRCRRPRRTRQSPASSASPSSA